MGGLFLGLVGAGGIGTENFVPFLNLYTPSSTLSPPKIMMYKNKTALTVMEFPNIVSSFKELKGFVRNYGIRI